MEVTAEKVRRKFGTDLLLQVPKVPYKETITTIAVLSTSTRSRQADMASMATSASVWSPLSGTWALSLAGRWWVVLCPESTSLVEKGVVKALQEGVVAGFPLVDLKVVLYDGSFHDVDSSGMAFEIASSYALRLGVAEAGPVLLEPVTSLNVTVPGRLHRRRYR